MALKLERKSIRETKNKNRNIKKIVSNPGDALAEEENGLFSHYAKNPITALFKATF